MRYVWKEISIFAELNNINPYKRYLAVALLLLSSLFVVPKELIHNLAPHTDTVDNSASLYDGITIGAHHHHCDILSVFIPPYQGSGKGIQFTEIIKIVSHYTFNTPPVSFQTVDCSSNRGPPSFCVLS